MKFTLTTIVVLFSLNSFASSLSMEKNVSAQLIMKEIVNNSLLGEDYPGYEELRGLYVYSLLGQSNLQFTEFECESSLGGFDTCFITADFDDGSHESKTKYRVQLKSGKVLSASIEEVAG